MIEKIDRRNEDIRNLRSSHQDEVFTTKEAMKYLKTTKDTLLKMIKEKKIRANKIGRGYRILKSEIDNYLRGESKEG